MKLKYCLASLLITFSCIIYSKASDLTPIEKWQDVTPFKGKIVAFQTTNPRYNTCFKEDREGRKYAKVDQYIWRCSDGEGYNIHKLLTSEEIPSAAVLTNSHLDPTSLWMGLPTTEELRQILKHLSEGKKRFAYSFNTEKDIALVKLQIEQDF